LNVVHIVLPPLRERLDDIPLLVDHLIRRYSQEYGVAPKRVTPEALARLGTHRWPGNVRELQNVIERAFALSVADTITVDDLPASVAGAHEPGAPSGVAVDGADVPTLGEAERRVIAAALRKSGGNKNEAARILGIDRQRLYRKIDKYRL
jgi:DNA-binding NtrC family response regulator